MEKKWFYITRWTVGLRAIESRDCSDVLYGLYEEILDKMSEKNFKNPLYKGVKVEELVSTGEKIDRKDMAQKHISSY